MIFSRWRSVVFGLNKGFCRNRYRSENVNIGHSVNLQSKELLLCKNRVTLLIILQNANNVLDSIFTIWYYSSNKNGDTIAKEIERWQT